MVVYSDQISQKELITEVSHYHKIKNHTSKKLQK